MADLLFTDAYLAQVYDLWHPRGVRDDFDFYMPLVMASGSVLDAGCGTGMMLHEARALGHGGRLVGLDPAPAMLALAARRADIEWRQGGLADAPWVEAFDLVVMTGHAFQALVTDEEIAAAMAAVRRLLRPGGCFAFETRDPAARAWDSWRPENAVTVRGPKGQPVRITTRVVEPFDGRTVSFTHDFAGQDAALPLQSRSTLRFLGAQEITERVESAGLVVEAQFGDWDRRPLGGPEIITFARR